MRDFSLLTHDDRYTTPTLHFISVATASRAREVAQRVLGESPHHLGVEVWDDDALLFRLDRPEDSRRRSAGS